MDHDVSKELLESIMRAVEDYWSDSEAESEYIDQDRLSILTDDSEDYRYDNPKLYFPCDDPEEEELEEPEDHTEEQEQAPGGDTEAPSSEARCAALEWLLVDVHQDDVFFRTISRALFKFCERGLHDEAEVLLRFNAHLDYTDFRYGFTPLHMAVEERDAKMVEVLMSSGASASQAATIPLDGQHCALVFACLREELECASIMLEHGADANAEDYEGRTPLMVLVEEQKSLDVLQLLLEKGADPNFLSRHGLHLESLLYDRLRETLGNGAEEQLERCDYGVKVVRLLLQYGFTPQCSKADFSKSLLELILEAFDQLFPLAAVLFERDDPFEPDHDCWSRLDILQEALTRALRGRSEAEARPLVDKANALLDLPIVRPPLLRFTLSLLQSQEGAGAGSVHQGAEWAVDTAPASLQSFCRAFIRRSLLPWPLEPKIQVLPIPDLIKDLLMPLKLD